ncbi:hypothetical protein MPNT_450006 [Candidatus Methylacidithermus pantelleriae]|uniref:Uncharacterized protein n=1 Tax=Candidatus Methylacidithermus pantelleriae TaxID=2744239 RepID=A0A8J2FTD8_9BACT|nr:hypothetical protein MPNT_450006 [Candidatus Methylacidithermus pantelleriae]
MGSLASGCDTRNPVKGLFTFFIKQAGFGLAEVGRRPESGFGQGLCLYVRARPLRIEKEQSLVVTTAPILKVPGPPKSSRKKRRGLASCTHPKGYRGFQRAGPSKRLVGGKRLCRFLLGESVPQIKRRVTEKTASYESECALIAGKRFLLASFALNRSLSFVTCNRTKLPRKVIGKISFPSLQLGGIPYPFSPLRFCMRG